MAGYDISGSTSYSNAANSAAGPATSGGIGAVGVSGNQLVVSSGDGTGLILPKTPSQAQAETINMIVLSAAALAGLYLWMKYGRKN